MTFQTSQNNKDNRYKNSPEGLPDEICSIWQGFQYANGTFDDSTDCDVEEIRALIDDVEEDYPSTQKSSV